jgi:hypothetical protein
MLGWVIGGLVALALVKVLLVLYCKRRRKKHKARAQTESKSPESAPKKRKSRSNKIAHYAPHGSPPSNSLSRSPRRWYEVASSDGSSVSNSAGREPLQGGMAVWKKAIQARNLQRARGTARSILRLRVFLAALGFVSLAAASINVGLSHDESSRFITKAILSVLSALTVACLYWQQCLFVAFHNPKVGFCGRQAQSLSSTGFLFQVEPDLC